MASRSGRNYPVIQIDDDFTGTVLVLWGTKTSRTVGRDATSRRDRFVFRGWKHRTIKRHFFFDRLCKSLIATTAEPKNDFALTQLTARTLDGSIMACWIMFDWIIQIWCKCVKKSAYAVSVKIRRVLRDYSVGIAQRQREGSIEESRITCQNERNVAR